MCLPLYTQNMEKSPSRWWDLPSAALFMLAILISVWRLTITDWTDNLGYVINLALAAALVGLALGASRFGKRGVRWLALGYTLTLLPRQLIAFYDNDIYLGERLIGVGGRLLFSISEFAANKPVKDPIFFIALVGTLYWFIALISGYQLTRHNNTLAAVLPAGLTMLVIHQFDPIPAGRIWLIAVYLFVALTLIGRGKYLRDRAGWVQRGVRLAPEAGHDLSMRMLIGAAALILVAWNLPLNFSDTALLASQWREVTRPWRATRDRLSQAFAALESKTRRPEYFGDTMPLGNQISQDTAVIFQVQAPPESLELPRLYWRSRIYDHYENGLWVTSQTTKGSFTPQRGNLLIPDTGQRQEYKFAITMYAQSQAILSLPSQPVWTSRPMNVTAFNLPDGKQDVVVLETFPFLEPGETYYASTYIANPTAPELRASGQVYPDWVVERYLQLPENFSRRVADFAKQATVGAETPYDKTKAITAALRAQVQYKASIILPPKGTDLMEWFLFEGRAGYCNYYATAEVLMLRSLGIPARLAVGFAQGEQSAGEMKFIVRHKDAHAWPEVYFPGYGWIEFEPTGNQDPFERLDPTPEPLIEVTPEADKPLSNRPKTPLDEDESTVDTPAKTTLLSRWWMALLAGGILLLSAATLRYTERRFELTRRAASYVLSTAERRGERSPAWVRNAALYVLANPFERAFHPVNVSLRWLGKSPAPHLTPAERAQALSALMPEAASEIKIILSEYHASQYSPRGGDIRRARRASRRLLWLGLRAAIRRAESNLRW
jgi:transglutaminase-like putative cysteine protease